MAAPDLLGPRPPKSRKAPASPTPRLIAVWVGLFEARFGERPVVRGRDGAALKRLIELAGEAVVERRLVQYIALDDPYIAGQGYPLALLEGVWGKLIVAEQPTRSRVPDATETENYLRKLRGDR